MTKKSKKKKQKKNNSGTAVSATNDAWLSQRTGLIVMLVVSLGFGGFMAWNLAPIDGWGMALLWGLGTAVAIWAVFALALGFNKFVRR